MAEYKAEQVQADAQRLEDWWSLRNRRITEWLKLERLLDEESLRSETRDLVLRGRERMITNDPATVIALSVALLSGSPPNHRIVVATDKEADFKRAGKSERAVRSWWREVDDQRFLAGKDEFLRELYFWLAATGWHAGLYGMVEGPDGPVPMAELHNPLEAFQEYGEGGMQTYVHRYYTTLADARDKAVRFGSTAELRGDGTQLVRITDWWKLVPARRPEAINGVLLEGLSREGVTGILWLKEPDRWGDYMPAISGPVAGNPDRGAYSRDDNWKRDMGKSVLEQNRVVYEEVNRYLSLLAQIAKDHAEPPWLAKGTGLLVKDSDLKGTGPQGIWTPGGKVIQTSNPNASLTRVDPGRAPIEVQQFLNVLEGMLQRGGLPYLLYGGAGVDLSGFAINQLLNAAQHRLGPYRQAGERVLKFVDKMWLEDSRREFADQPVAVSGRNLQSGRHGGYFYEEFKATDIPKHLVTEVQQPLSLPNDLVSRIAIVRQAIPDGPILDMLTALDEVLQFEDPHLIMERLDQDSVKPFRNPQVNQINMVTELKQRAKDLRDQGGQEAIETAVMLEQFAEFMMQGLAQMGVQGKGPARNSSGMAPEVQNAAERGISPDLRRSVLRERPGTPNRSREEQLAGMGVMG